MNATTLRASVKSNTAWPAILWGSLACGVLDISAALVVYGSFGLKPLRLLQAIAGEVPGPQTYEGGLTTALRGLACHFGIAFSAAAVYLALSRRMPFWSNTQSKRARSTALPSTSS